jgi:glycosyltransferase involved in cell wall biosynthesis
MNGVNTKTKVVLAGHPFVPIGMGEHIRCSFRSFQSVGVDVGVKDIFGSCEPDPDIKDEFHDHLVPELGSDLNIFHINGDEIESTLTHLGGDLPANAHNVIYPMWELSKYPKDWAKQLNRFDEIWAPSKFVYGSIAPAATRPVFLMPVSGQISFKSFLGRRHFNIPEGSFTFLFYFDLTSYIERKNPFAVLEAFERLCSVRPNDDLCIVMKLKGGEMKSEHSERLHSYVSRLGNKLILVERLLSDNEIKNLLRCSDCFVSLHRSEGFGLGLINAMFLGKPAIATAYSANMDFMNEGNSCLVRYDLCAVPDGAYPFSKDQVWADPDIDQAVEHMLNLVSDRDHGRAIGSEASRHIRTNFSYRAAGLRYADRIREIAAEPVSFQVGT